jgi:hypothetical protein
MRRALLIAMAALLAFAAPAGAQAVATATPNVPGAGAQLHFDVDAVMPPLDGRIPSALALAAGPGSAFNARAAAALCTRTQAALNECPRGSRIGSGRLIIQVNAPPEWGGSRDVAVPLTLHLQTQTTRKVLAVAFLSGFRVVPGLISTTNGLVVSFDPLPTPPDFPGVTYLLKRVTLDIGTTRLAKRPKKKSARRQKGSAARTRVYLIRNPAQCATGGWQSSVTFAFPDGTTTALAAPTPCTAG